MHVAQLWFFVLTQRFLKNPLMYISTDVTGIDSLQKDQESWQNIPLGEDDRLLSNLSRSLSLFREG